MLLLIFSVLRLAVMRFEPRQDERSLYASYTCGQDQLRTSGSHFARLRSERVRLLRSTGTSADHVRGSKSGLLWLRTHFLTRPELSFAAWKLFGEVV